MKKEEYILFLREVSVKIENAINLLVHHEPPRHILTYRKMLGVKQKLLELNVEYRSKMFPQIVIVKSVINYLINGRYEEAATQIQKLKKEIIKISLNIDNETNSNG